MSDEKAPADKAKMIIPEGHERVSIARTVLYVQPDGTLRGEVRPAIVTHAYESTGLRQLVNLTVFFRQGDTVHGYAAVETRSEIPFDFGRGPGTWHWPPR